MIDRETITRQLIEAGVIQEDGCGLFLAAGLASEVIDAAAAVAQKAAEVEREACAQVADAIEKSIYFFTNTTYLIECASAIRARGTASL